MSNQHSSSVRPSVAPVVLLCAAGAAAILAGGLAGGTSLSALAAAVMGAVFAVGAGDALVRARRAVAARAALVTALAPGSGAAEAEAPEENAADAPVDAPRDASQPSAATDLATVLAALPGTLAGRVRARLVAVPVPSAAAGLARPVALAVAACGLAGTLAAALASLGAGTGLAAPATPDGMLPAFGLTAAGLAAAVALLLAHASGQRAESAVDEAIAIAVAGPLAEHSSAARSERALLALAGHGEALPRAAQALTDAAARIDALQVALGAAHDRAASDTRTALREAVDATRDGLRESMSELAAASHRTLEPLVQRAGDDARTAVAGLVEKVSGALTDDLAARREQAREADERTAERIAALLERLDEHAGARRDADAEHALALRSNIAALVARLDKHLETRREADDQHLARVEERTGELLARLAADAEDRHEAARRAREEDATHGQELLEGLDGRIAQLFERLEADLDARRRAELEARDELRQRDADAARAETERADRISQIWQELTSAVQHAQDEAARRDQERAELLDRTVRELGAELGGSAAAVHEHLQSTGRAEDERLARIDALAEQLRNTADAITRAAERSGHAADKFAQTAEARADTAHSMLAEHLAQVTAQLDHAQRAQRDGWRDFERALLRLHKAAFDAGLDTLARHADGLHEDVASTVAIAHEAAETMRAGGAEICAVAEMFANVVDRHREAAEAWIENLGAVEAAIESAGEGAAAASLQEQLDATQELFARQLDFHRELYDQLRELRAPAISPGATSADSAQA